MKALSILAASLLAGSALATTYPMTMHTVVDDKGVHGVAFRYLAPKGWKTQAHLTWTGNLLAPTLLTLVANSPDDRFGYATFSSLDFPFNGHGPSPYGGGGYQVGKQPPRVLSDYLLEQLKAVMPKTSFTVTKRDDKPLTGSDLPFRRNFGMASQIEFAYTDEKGRACAGVMAARCDGEVQQTDGGMGAIYGGDWRVDNLVMVSGPKGEEKQALKYFALSVPTITATRPFAALRYAYVDMLNEKLKADTAAMLQRSQAMLKANRERFDQYNAQWREHEAATDKASRDFCDYVGDVERFRGMNGEEIKATATPGGAWQDPNGNVILSDDPHYNPNRPGSPVWNKLQHAH